MSQSSPETSVRAVLPCVRSSGSVAGRLRVLLIVGVSTIFAALPLCAQESRPAESGPVDPDSQPTTQASALAGEMDAAQKEAEDVLRDVDRRLYRARDHGLKDLKLAWRVKGEGTFESLDVTFRYGWRLPDRTMIRPFDSEGKPVTATPEVLASQPETFRQMMESLDAAVKTRLIGRPYVEIYKNYYKSVSRREVNNKIETRVEMVPQTKRVWTKIVLKFRDGIPYEEVRTTAEGRTINVFLAFEKIEGQFLLKSMRTEIQNVVKDEEHYNYIMRDGIAILGSYEKNATYPKPSKTVIKFDDIEVNQGIDDSWFESK